MKQKLFFLIKIASIMLITGALGLEIGYLYLKLTNGLLANKLYLIWCLGNFALVAHLIEGVIAALKAKTYHRDPITYGVYTFFVGFVGLWELQKNSSSSKVNI